MLDWHSCQICYPLEIKILLISNVESTNVMNSSHGGYCLTRLKSEVHEI